MNAKCSGDSEEMTFTRQRLQILWRRPFRLTGKLRTFSIYSWLIAFPICLKGMVPKQTLVRSLVPCTPIKALVPESCNIGPVPHYLAYFCLAILGVLIISLLEPGKLNVCGHRLLSEKCRMLVAMSARVSKNSITAHLLSWTY